jgi:hypothetical protein
MIVLPMPRVLIPLEAMNVFVKEAIQAMGSNVVSKHK